MARLLRGQGYEASALEGGYTAWKTGGFPLEPKGTAPRQPVIELVQRAEAD